MKLKDLIKKFDGLFTEHYDNLNRSYEYSNCTTDTTAVLPDHMYQTGSIESTRKQGHAVAVHSLNLHLQAALQRYFSKYTF